MTALQARDVAMAQVDANADDYWKNCVEETIRRICRELGFSGRFSTDLVWKYLEEDFPNAATHERKAMGPAMSAAAKQGLIRKTGDWVESDRIECHARPVAVWAVATFSA